MLFRSPGRLLFPIAFISITANILPYTVLPHLVSLYGSAFIGMMIGLVPFMTILFSIPMLKVWPTKLQAAGVVSGLVCLAIIFSDGLQRSIPLAVYFWQFLLLPLILLQTRLSKKTCLPFHLCPSHVVC